MTLIEILLSLALLSIVMIFTFNILADLANEELLSNKRSADAINRATIIRLVQNDFINKGVKEIRNCTVTNSVCLDIFFKDNTEKKLIFEEKKVTYDNEMWELKVGKYDLNNFKFCYNDKIEYNGTLSSYFYLKLIMPLSSSISNNNKYDIELTLIADQPGWTENKIYLPNGNQATC